MMGILSRLAATLLWCGIIIIIIITTTTTTLSSSLSSSSLHVSAAVQLPPSRRCRHSSGCSQQQQQQQQQLSRRTLVVTAGATAASLPFQWLLAPHAAMALAVSPSQQQQQQQSNTLGSSPTLNLAVEPTTTTTTTTNTTTTTTNTAYQKTMPDFGYTFEPPSWSEFEMGNKPLKTHLDEVNFNSRTTRGYQFGITVDPVRIGTLKEVCHYTVQYVELLCTFLSLLLDSIYIM